MLVNLFPAVVQHETMTMDEHHVDVKKNAFELCQQCGFSKLSCKKCTYLINCCSFNLVLPDIKGDNIKTYIQVICASFINVT